MRLLVVEDYAPIRVSIVQALREDGHSVDEAATGDDGLWQASRNAYDVVVLDLMLPGMDGLEVLAQMRKDGIDSHVLVLTARDALDDRVRGLDLGADDYLVKPFAMDELRARVRALVRRAYKSKDPVIRVGHIAVDTSDHTVQVDGEAVELTAKEYALLDYLVHRVGQVVSRADIWEHVYDAHSTTMSNVVDVYIGYLRKKLERPGRPRLIRTRRGEGYMLVDERSPDAPGDARRAT